MPILSCPCGKSKTVSAYAAARRKYCSAECASRFRVYATKPETLGEKVSVTLTWAQRDALQNAANLVGVPVTDWCRFYILQALALIGHAPNGSRQAMRHQA